MKHYFAMVVVPRANWFCSVDPTLSLRLPQVTGFIVQLVELLSTSPKLLQNFTKLDCNLVWNYVDTLSPLRGNKEIRRPVF
jgi:hypothetical protein